MTPENKEMAIWTGMVITFFSCLAIAVHIDNPDSLIAQGCMVVAVCLAFPLYYRFRWFRVMIWCLLAFIIICCYIGRERDSKDKRD